MNGNHTGDAKKILGMIKSRQGKVLAQKPLSLALNNFLNFKIKERRVCQNQLCRWWEVVEMNSLTIFSFFQIFYCGRMNNHVKKKFIFNLGVVVFSSFYQKKREKPRLKMWMTESVACAICITCFCVNSFYRNSFALILSLNSLFHFSLCPSIQFEMWMSVSFMLLDFFQTKKKFTIQER